MTLAQSQVRHRFRDEWKSVLDNDSLAFVASLILHLCLLLGLGLAPLFFDRDEVTLTLAAPIDDELLEDELLLPEEFHVSERPLPEIGSNSVAGEQMALSAAEVLADLSDVPSPTDLPTIDVARLETNETIEIATAMHQDHLPVRGAVGTVTTGVPGAIDRITQDILLSLEERPTLVVWLFDQSGSMLRQRQEVHRRLSRVYEELGVIEAAGNPAFDRDNTKPLLSSVVAFGKQVRFMLDKPTDDVGQVKSAIQSVALDDSGQEKVFTALYAAAERFKRYRRTRPYRNVMLIAFTDEAGSDQRGLDETVQLCRRYEMPVYVVGIPAPFGRRETLVKWVDPDPKYDQSPQWSPVDQGPESLFLERVQLAFFDGGNLDPMDSGFGPFALTRVCYETGGIYFAVHPNRNVNRRVGRGETADFSAHLKHFFDPEVMRKYRPDYVSQQEYVRQVNSSKSRSALLRAAQLSSVGRMESPQRRFVRRSEAELSAALSEAQKAAARLEPPLNELYATLRVGEADREKEISARWQAGFDLAMGRVLAAKVRTEAYNAMLAQAKRGMEFKDPKKNTWLLVGSDEISVGSKLTKAGETARMYLERVVREHPKTPWALLAQRELGSPLGWEWQEAFTDLSPPPRRTTPSARPARRPPSNDRPRTIRKPPPKRSPPKL